MEVFGWSALYTFSSISIYPVGKYLNCFLHHWQPAWADKRGRPLCKACHPSTKGRQDCADSPKTSQSQATMGAQGDVSERSRVNISFSSGLRRTNATVIFLSTDSERKTQPRKDTPLVCPLWISQGTTEGAGEGFHLVAFHWIAMSQEKAHN